MQTSLKFWLSADSPANIASLVSRECNLDLETVRQCVDAALSTLDDAAKFVTFTIAEHRIAIVLDCLYPYLDNQLPMELMCGGFGGFKPTEVVVVHTF